MNHSNVKTSISEQLKNEVALPFLSHISSAKQSPFLVTGADGKSNVFSAALWVLDYALYCASQ